MCFACAGARLSSASAPCPSACIGAPLNNGTLFCELDACFLYRPAAVAQGAARNACQALGGELPLYLSFEAQHRVERYFQKQVPLYSYWWAVAGRLRPGARPLAHCCWRALLTLGRRHLGLAPRSWQVGRCLP
jgi:hypothetical protein